MGINFTMGIKNLSKAFALNIGANWTFRLEG
jgi:hypothetical protein